MKSFLLKNWLLVALSLIIVSGLFVLANYYYNKAVLEQSLTENSGDYVVLLHGLGRTSFSMQPLGRQLARQGYRVINIGYPSRSATVEDLVEQNLKPVLIDKYTDPSRQLNFVTHSMGGILARYYLQNNQVENLGRLVMLAPPNQGSEAADRWTQNRLIRFILGPALLELSTKATSFVNKLSLPNYEFGIISAQHDGKVSIGRTQLANQIDFLVVPVMHTWIMNNDEVLGAVLSFLELGEFKNN